jgi:hypothetical protein
LAITLAVVVLFSAGAAGLIVLVPIGVAAGVVLAILRPRPSVREIGFALALSLLAMAGGLLWMSFDFSPPMRPSRGSGLGRRP